MGKGMTFLHVKRYGFVVAVILMLLLSPVITGMSQNRLLQTNPNSEASSQPGETASSDQPTLPTPRSLPQPPNPKKSIGDYSLLGVDPIWHVGPVGQNFTKIQDAVDNASDGDRIIVHNGTYNENVIIHNKTLTLEAFGGDVPFVNGEGGICFNVTSNEYDEISIIGFNMTTGDEAPSAVYIDGTSTVNITSNIINFMAVASAAIDLGFIYGKIYVNENTIDTNDYGVSIDFGYCDIQVNNNTVNAGGDGVHINFGVGHVEVSGNNITSTNWNGIYAYEVIGGFTANMNNITADDDGIHIEFSGGYTIANKNIIKSWMNGIYVGEAYSYLWINENTMKTGEDNVVLYGGVYIESGYGGAEIKNNNITQYYHGIFVNVLGYVYVGNNFINSTGPASYEIFGIWLQSFGAVVEHNTIYSHSNGIMVTQGAGNFRIYNNTIQLSTIISHVGIVIDYADGCLEVEENTIHASTGDFGIYIEEFIGKATILRNILDANLFMGMYVELVGPCTIVHNTIYNVTDCGIYLESTVTNTTAVKNNIVVGINVNTTIGVYGGVSGNCTQGVGYNDLFNCNLTLSTYSPANGDISADPEFVNATTADYRLLDTSPCIDAGIDIGLPYSGAAPNMGAYEFIVSPMMESLLELKAEILDLPYGAFKSHPHDWVLAFMLSYVDAAISMYDRGDTYGAKLMLSWLRDTVINWLTEPWKSTLTTKIDNITSQL